VLDEAHSSSGTVLDEVTVTHIAQPSSTTSDLAAISVSCIADKLVYESGQMCTMQSHESGLMFSVHHAVS